MSVQVGFGKFSNYFSRFYVLVRRSAAQLAHPPSHLRRAEAARRLGRRSLAMAALVCGTVFALMYGFDAMEIGLMPPRGTASLWPVRIVSDLGKSVYVLLFLAVMLLVIALASVVVHGSSRSRLRDLGLHLQFVFFAVLLPVLAGELIKWVVGRGRPFVGDKANAFNFAPFVGTEAYASFPSAHAITAFALAFAVSAVWPQARIVMAVYAILIAASRLVLLAHHSSDVVAGAVIGIVGAMFVRYWFAARCLAFAIHDDGAITPLRSIRNPLKRVARKPSAS